MILYQAAPQEIAGLAVTSAEIWHRPCEPAFPASWTGSGGLEFFLGNPAQQAVFQLMLHAYNKARLTRDRGIVDVALWLLQSDHLHLIQWFGRRGAEAEVSAYFTPAEWWGLGGEGIVREIVQVYLNFVRAIGVDSRRARRRDTGALPILDPEIADTVRPAPAQNARRRHEPAHGMGDLYRARQTSSVGLSPREQRGGWSGLMRVPIVFNTSASTRREQRKQRRMLQR